MSCSDLLGMLNSIADLVIGNERAEDVGFKERTTLPELLSYVIMYPKDRENIVATERKLEELTEKIRELKHELFVLKKTIDIKKKPLTL